MEAEKRRSLFAAVGIIAGIIFICVGILRGEAGTVLQKAVHICLECIGIG